MKTKCRTRFTVVLTLAILTSGAQAANLPLSGTLDVSSRFYDYFSDAYAEVGLEPDGFYQIGNPATQYGSYDVFPTEPDLILGPLTYDDARVTGKGIETAPVTGLVLDLQSTVDTAAGEYTTTLSGLSGTLTLTNGVPQALVLNAAVTLQYTSGLLNGLVFDGSLAITNGAIEVDVDRTHATPFGQLRRRWDLTGTVALPRPTPAAGALLVGFTGTLATNGFVGPDNLSPFVPGNPLHAFVASGQPDVLRVDGQFYVSGWDGSDGEFLVGPNGSTPGARFFLHSPLVERIEAQTWRIEGPSSHETVNGTNGPVEQRSKILLPASRTFGIARLVVSNGVPVSLNYLLDFTQPGVPGFDGTSFNDVQFLAIRLSSDGVSFGVPQTFEIGVNDAAVPYGLNTRLSTGAFPMRVLSSTVTATTRGQLRRELFENVDERGGATPNISADGRLNGGVFPMASTPTGSVYLADPFATETGSVTVFTPSELQLGITVDNRASGLVLQGVSLGTSSLSWPGLPGVIYRVQRRPSLESGDWLDVSGPIAGEREILSVAITIPESETSYFRVLSTLAR